jgi:hypothetical protein
MDKYKQRAVFLASLFCLLCLQPLNMASAAPQDLFEVERVVPNQTPGTRSVALKAGLKQVLVRVAGQASVLESGPAQALLASPSRLVQQYRYFTVPDSEPPVLKLWMRFDGDAIRRSLQQQGMAYWGTERPDTLVWLAVEDRGNRYVVAADGGSDVHQQIEKAARQRGVPILFPLMDLEDQSKARFSDIWGGFFENVLAASDRYSPQAVLIGRLNRSPSGGWSSRWHLQVAGKPSSWSDSRPGLDALAQQGIDDTADILASTFAVEQDGGGLNTISIVVSGVDTLAAYARINHYLSSLTSVAGFQVREVTGSEVQYALQVNGGLQNLTRTVTIGTVLEPAADGMPGSYRLRQ